jgi:FKBP-type peptidyl-prolyl cis-trans isomerase
MRALCLAALFLAAACASADPPELPVFPPALVSGDTLSLTGGLRAIVVQPGEGPAARSGDQVRVHYTGWLEDGRIFDNSRSRDPLVFQLGRGQVIQGWELGIAGMRAGERRRLLIPETLAYGSAGRGPIPPHAPLIFDVELLEILR